VAPCCNQSEVYDEEPPNATMKKVDWGCFLVTKGLQQRGTQGEEIKTGRGAGRCRAFNPINDSPGKVKIGKKS